MNIFVLDYDQVNNTQCYTNKHTVKMILEYAQLVSTALHTYDIKFESQYKISHQNHPSSIWARKSRENLEWLCELGICLGEEYTYRYGKIHKSVGVIKNAKQHANQLPSFGLTPFALCMPDEYRRPDAVEAYRTYYREGKKHLLTYTKRKPPEWLSDLPIVYKE